MTISQERSVTVGEQAVYDKDAQILAQVRKTLRWRLWRIKMKVRRANSGGGNIAHVELPRSTNHFNGQVVARIATEFMLGKGIGVKCIVYPNQMNLHTDTHRHLIIIKT